MKLVPLFLVPLLRSSRQARSGLHSQVTAHHSSGVVDVVLVVVVVVVVGLVVVVVVVAAVPAGSLRPTISRIQALALAILFLVFGKDGMGMHPVQPPLGLDWSSVVRENVLTRKA